MTGTYDKEADAAYIEFSTNPVGEVLTDGGLAI